MSSQAVTKALTVGTDEMLDRIKKARIALFGAGKREPYRQLEDLPVALSGYRPATYWHDSTLELFHAIKEKELKTVGYFPNKATVIVPTNVYMNVLSDLVYTMGPTPWNDPTERDDMSIMFAGQLISPDCVEQINVGTN